MWTYSRSIGLGRPFSICPYFQPPCKRKAGKKNHKAVMQQPECVLTSLPAQTASIVLLNMGHCLITWTTAGGISLAEDMAQGRASVSPSSVSSSLYWRLIIFFPNLMSEVCCFAWAANYSGDWLKPLFAVNELLKGKTVPFKGHFLPWVIHIEFPLNSKSIAHTHPRAEFTPKLWTPQDCEIIKSLKTVSLYAVETVLTST